MKKNNNHIWFLHTYFVDTLLLDIMVDIDTVEMYSMNRLQRNGSYSNLLDTCNHTKHCIEKATAIKYRSHWRATCFISWKRLLCFCFAFVLIFISTTKLTTECFVLLRPQSLQLCDYLIRPQSLKLSDYFFRYWPQNLQLFDYIFRPQSLEPCKCACADPTVMSLPGGGVGGSEAFFWGNFMM